MSKKKLQYIQCNKQGFHYGEVLNMVCIEQNCLQNLICCCACAEQQHKAHMIKPLKMVMTQANQHSTSMKPAKFNADVIIDIINSSQKNALINFTDKKKKIISKLDSIENSIISYYSYIIEQIKLKSSDPKVQIEKAFEVIYAPKTIEKFRDAVKKIVSIIPKKDEQPTANLTESELIDEINSSNDEICQMVGKNIEEINQKLSQHCKILENSINTNNIWKRGPNFKFSSTFKHQDVKVISDTVIKSVNSSGYKFCVMEPNLQKGAKIKTFAFKIKQSTSNWVAIGMCHKKIVATKNYAFNFSTVGHGGYLISANGGSWSNSKPECNNAVKAFKFTKGDTISVTVNLQTKIIRFNKNKQVYELSFEKITDDQLHPCALFYYINDEVQYLPKYKPE